MSGEMNSDRISCLPEYLIHHIFSISFITTKQAVQMSLLSKQWRHFWKSLPYIRIENLARFYMSKEEKKFTTFFNEVLALRCESNLHTFYLTDKSEICYAGDDDDELIDFLITLKVQEIHLLHPLYISKSAVTRLLNQNHIRSLELVQVTIGDEDGFDGDRELIISSSSMENLVLDCEYDYIYSITIHGPKLKYLNLGNHYYNPVDDIKIHAPALTQIHLNGDPYDNFYLENTSSLIDVSYNMSNIWYYNKESFGPFSNFLKALVTAKSFTFNTFHLENHLNEGLDEDIIVGPTEEYFWNSIQASVLNVNHLEVQNWHTSLHIHTLAKFIEKFSSLETLVLVRYQAYDNNSAARVKNERDWDEQLAFECCFSKLKSVEIRDIQGHKNELIFIAFLLRSAPVLQKFNISINRSLFSRDEQEYSEMLHSLPSFSPSVTISLRFT